MVQNTKNVNLKTAGFSIFNNPKNSVSNSLGYSVSGVGDIDKDGLDDVIVGAPAADETNDIDASIYIIYGNGTSSNIDLSHPITPIARIYDSNQIDKWGYSVSGAGDFNGDGFPDVIIGAPGANNGKGFVEIWYGSPAGLFFDYLINGADVDDYTGHSVSGAGDFNGDGYDDVIIGAYNAGPGGLLGYPGVSYIFFGGIKLSNTYIKITGVASKDQSGYSVSGAGDVNGDGFPDVIIGAPWADYKTSAVAVGAAYIVYGSHTLHNMNLGSLNSTTGFTIYGEARGSQTGYSVSGAGDVNGDGFADVIIGAPWINNKAGITYIIYGKSINTDINLAQLTENKGIAIYGIDFEDFSGYSVSNIGDINRDGYDDVIIGAPEAVIIADQYSGVSYVIYGNKKLYNIDLSSLEETQGFRIFSYAPHNAHLGAAVSGAGDVNGDGYLDIIVGAPGNIPDLVEKDTQTAAGVQRAYVILGKSAFNLNTNVTSFSNAVFLKDQDPTSKFGYSVGNIGNFNEDVFEDVIIGFPAINGGSGACYVMLGNNSLENQLLAFNKLTPTSTPTIKPTTIPTANPSVMPTQSPSGNSQAKYNSFTKALVIYGESESRSGTSVSGGVDINKDGFDDIIIGAPGYNHSLGFTYIIYGYPIDGYPDEIFLYNLQSTQGFYISGVKEGDESGYSVSGAGDMNNDGYDDIAIGAPGANSNTGDVYIIYGKGQNNVNLNLNDLSNHQGIVISGINIKDQTGWSVGRAGDFDKDGCSDIIIGAPGTNKGKGESYLIYGSRNPSDIKLSDLNKQITLGFPIYGNNVGDGCGWSVSGAGDVNNDGYDDIIIGAPYANGGVGVSYVIYGKPKKTYTSIDLSKGLSATQGFIINGETNYVGNSGYSVSSAGDVNNDNFTDIIVGAPEANIGKGKAYLVYGFYSTYEQEIIINLAELENANPFNSKGFIIEGAYNLGSAGASVSSAGDMNHDNFTDIIVGAPGLGTSSSYIIYGSQNRIQEEQTPSPSYYPTYKPTTWEHGGKVWVEDHPYAIPLMVFGVTSMPVLFSKQICFRILEIWEPYKDDRSSYINAGKSYIYKACEYAFMSKYLDWKEENERKEEVLLRRASNQIEKSELDERIGSRQVEMTEINSGAEDRIPEYIMEGGQAIVNPLRDSRSPALSESSQLDEATEIARQKRASYRGDGDSKKSCVVCAIPDVIHNNPLLNHPQSSEIFRYAREVGGTKAVKTLLDYQGYISNDVNEIKGAIKEIFADTSTADNHIAVTSKPSAPTADLLSPTSNNNLMISLLSAQQIVEYIQIIKYLAQGVNITLPEVLDNKPMLISTHLVLGNAAAALLPYESITNGIITSSVATSSYAMKLVSAGYLADKRQQAMDQDKPMSSFETLKYCGVSILSYTLPNLAKCTVTKWFIPEAECSITGYDLSISTSLGGADCYAMYKATREPSMPTTADIVVPYMLDAIALAITSQYVTLGLSNAVMAMQSVKQVMSVVSTVVVTDYVSRVAMDMAPKEVKEGYIGKALTYVSDYIDNVYQTANNLGSCIIEENNSMLGCFTTANLAQEL